jgi:class 3 adenylate cyclase
VVFCDLVNSTSLAAQLDPEQWREIIAGYYRAATQAIKGFGGHVAQYVGDGVMAYFGYPEAHDNNAERAARAALAILDGISRLNEQSARPKLSARIGIHSGTVVVGAGKDVELFGDTLNIAARVQAAAQPDTVVITDASHRLVAGLFVVEERGAPPLKGVAQPVELYRIVRPSAARRSNTAFRARKAIRESKDSLVAEWIRTAGSACSSESSRSLSVPLSPLAPVSADGENETGREPAMSISNQRDRQFESTPLRHTVCCCGNLHGTARNGRFCGSF